MPEDKYAVALSNYRLSQAKSDWEGAEKNLALNEFKIANNRAYYSIFHAIRAVIALDGVDFKKHSGVISYFQQKYIKTGVIDKKFSRVLQDAFEVRQEADYEDFFVISKQETEEQIENVTELVMTVQQYVLEKLK